MDINFSIIGSRIRDVRNLRGYTSDVLSERVNLSSESLRHIEIGASKPSLKTLFAIAEALDVSLDYLTGRTPSLQESFAVDHAKELKLSDRQLQMLSEVVNDMIPIVSKYV